MNEILDNKIYEDDAKVVGLPNSNIIAMGKFKNPALEETPAVSETNTFESPAENTFEVPNQTVQAEENSFNFETTTAPVVEETNTFDNVNTFDNAADPVAPEAEKENTFDFNVTPSFEQKEEVKPVEEVKEEKPIIPEGNMFDQPVDTGISYSVPVTPVKEEKVTDLTAIAEELKALKERVSALEDFRRTEEETIRKAA